MSAAECIVGDCKRSPDAGRWCREHWDYLIDRDVKIEAAQPSSYLAREVVRLRRQLDFVREVEGIVAFGQCCGHMEVVHTHGGCNGLIGADDIPCPCLRWDPRS